MFFVIRYRNTIILLRHESEMCEDDSLSASRSHRLVIDDVASGMAFCECQAWYFPTPKRTTPYREIYREMIQQFKEHCSEISRREEILRPTDPCANCKLKIDCKVCMG